MALCPMISCPRSAQRMVKGDEFFWERPDCRQLQMEQQLRNEMQAQLMNQVKQNEKLSSQVAELAAR